MLLGILAVALLAPIYWVTVPQRWRRDVLSFGSLAALGAYDYRLVPLLLSVCFILFALMRTTAARRAEQRSFVVVALGLVGLAALFFWNKLVGSGVGALPAQSGPGVPRCFPIWLSRRPRH